MPVGIHALTQSGTTTKTTPARNSAASGSTFVVLVAMDRTKTVSSVTDNKGNTYTLRGTQQVNFAFDLGLSAYVCENGSGGTGHQATVVFSADAFSSVGLFELTGVSAASFDNIWQGNDASTPFDAVTTADFAQANTLVLGVVSTDSSAATVNAAESTGFTLVEETTDGVNYFNLHVFEKTVAATTALTPSFTANAAANASIFVIAFKLSGSDTTAPVLTSPTGSATSPVAATVGVTTDEANGTLYVVVTTSATQPSIAQIKAGQDHTSTAAVYASSQSISSTGAKTFSATGLTPNTTYYAHFVHTDSSANDSARSTSASFKTYQRVVCTADVVDGSWLPNSGADLFAVLDENPASDADYIYTLTPADSCTVALGAAGDPAVSTNHTVRYRLIGDGVSGVLVELLQGASVIASWTHDPAPSTWTQYDQTLSGGQADSITDYTSLRVRFTEV